MKPEDQNAAPVVAAEELRGQRLAIPDLRPVFATWKQGISPLYSRIKEAVDMRLGDLIADERVLAKVKAADIGLFASGWFPDASYEVLETVAFYCIWLFLWDDAIDGASVLVDGGLAADEYCQQSVTFVRFYLGLGEDGAAEPEPPTKVCGSFAEVGRRFREYGELADRESLFEHLKEYMEGCVTEYRWRLSGKRPSVDEFYSWRLRTSSVDAMLDLCRMSNKISLPEAVFQSGELAAMGLSVNGLLILINEIFSLKKELRDGAYGNLIPITMHSLSVDLEGAVQSLIQDIHRCITSFAENASILQEKAVREHGPEAADQLAKLVDSYQAVATNVLHYSTHSPRYGLLKDRQEDGSFVVVL